MPAEAVKVTNIQAGREQNTTNIQVTVPKQLKTLQWVIIRQYITFYIINHRWMRWMDGWGVSSNEINN